MNEVTIFLSQEEADKWLEFQKNYQTFILMLNKGVFNIRSGSAVLNFDANGHITTIQRADMLYNIRVEEKKLSTT